MRLPDPRPVLGVVSPDSDFFDEDKGVSPLSYSTVVLLHSVL